MALALPAGHELAQVADHLPCPQCLLTRFVDRVPEHGHRLPLHPLQDPAAALEIVRDRRQGLVDFVGECRSHLAECSKPRHVDEFGLQLLQACLGLLPLRQIPDEAGEVADASRAHLAHGQLHGKGRPVLAQSDNHAPDPDDPPLARAAVALHVGVVLLAIGRRHEELDVLADDLIRQVAEEPHGGGAERLDPRFLVDHHHGIGHRLQDGSQMGFAGPQGFLGADPLANVAGDHGKAALAEVGAGNGSDRHSRHECRAVLANAKPLRLVASVVACRLEIPVEAARVSAVPQIQDGCRTPERVACAPPEDFLGAPVPARDVSLRIEHEKRRIRHRIDEKFCGHAWRARPICIETCFCHVSHSM